MKSEFYIRLATQDDTDLILQFIRELAEYEKLLHEVVATSAELKSTLFGEKSYAEVNLAYFNEKPVGFALFFHNYSTFLSKPGLYIEDLYVKPEMRGKGLGKKILCFMAALAKKRNCGRLEWWVLDWNEEAIGFYKKIGAKAMSDWTVYRVTGTSLDLLASEYITP